MAEAAASLTFYTNPMSRGRVARWMLEEVGEPYEVRFVDYGGPMKGPEYRAVNPMGKVPALKHGEAVVTEVAAICAYLADAFPKAGLAPPPPERADYYRWLFFFAGPVEMATVNESFGWRTDDPMERGRTGYGTIKAVLDTMEGAVREREFIAGDAFTAADVYCGMHVFWGLKFGSIERRPAFEAYWSRLAEREAFKRAAKLDDEAMGEQSS